MTTPEDWHTPEQAVHFFPDTAPSTLRRQARAGLVPSRRFARRIYFSASDIAADPRGVTRPRPTTTRPEPAIEGADPMTPRERTITLLGGLLATAAFIIATYGVMYLALFIARLTGKLP